MQVKLQHILLEYPTSSAKHINRVKQWPNDQKLILLVTIQLGGPPERDYYN